MVSGQQTLAVSLLAGLQIQQIAAFADVEAARAADPVALSAAFVDVPAKKHFGLLAFHPFTHGAASCVLSGREFVKLAAIGRSVHHQIERRQIAKRVQRLSDLLFAVFAGCVERSGIAVAEAGPVGRANLAYLLVKICEVRSRAEFLILRGGFMIARKRPHPAGLFRENRRARVQPFAKGAQIPGRDVNIGRNAEQFFEGPQVAVNVAENLNFHRTSAAGVAPASSGRARSPYLSIWLMEWI